jgi:hypothetical protein
LHYPITRHATAHVNVAVIGVAAKRELPSFQLLVQVIEQNIGKQRGERATLAGASASSLRFEIIRPTLGFVVRPFGIIAYYGLC